MGTVDSEDFRKQAKVPEGLDILQAHFGEAIRIPFDFSSGHFVYQQSQYSSDIVEVMVDREPVGEEKRLVGIDRLSVYNQQYWYRLLTVLQKDFPLLRHLLGCWHLNRLSTDYLTMYPSKSPNLNNLADKMLEFLDKNKHWGTEINRTVAVFELQYSRSFVEAEREVFAPKSLSTAEAAALASQALHFQPSFALFHHHWDIAENYFKARQDESDELELSLKPVEQYWAMYRDGTQISLEPLDSLAFKLLSLLHQGEALESACESVAEKLESEGLQKLEQNLPLWFARWASLGWFCEGT